MVINADTTLSIYPKWVKDGYLAAQNTLSSQYSGADLNTAVQAQDNVVWTYWNNLHKAKPSDRWHEDWFASDIDNAIKNNSGVYSQALKVLKQALVDSKASFNKANILMQSTDNTSPAPQPATGQGGANPSDSGSGSLPKDNSTNGQGAQNTKSLATKSSLPIVPIIIGGLIVVGVIGFVIYKRNQSQSPQ